MITIPTLAAIYNGIISDLETEFNTTIPLFGKNYLRIQAFVQAAKIKLLYLQLANLQKNIFADTAQSESSGGTLERFGRVKLNRGPFPATAGQYTIRITGSIGATVFANTVFKSNDDSSSPGKLFILDVTKVLTATTDYINVRALESGNDSQLAVNDKLTATAPIALVNNLGVVTAEIVEPFAAEDIETYRQKVLDAYRLEPQGGAASDYRLWSYDAQGVQQVYPYAKSGSPNEIDVYVEATIADSTDGKGTPSAGLLTEVYDVISLDPDTTRSIYDRGRLPLGVYACNVIPVVVKQVDIIIVSFSGLTAAIQATLLAAIREHIESVRPFIAGADILSEQNDILSSNNIISVILKARPGSVFGEISIGVNGNLYSSYTFDNGEIPYLNSVTYS